MQSYRSIKKLLACKWISAHVHTECSSGWLFPQLLVLLTLDHCFNYILLSVCASILVPLGDNGVHPLPNSSYMMEYIQSKYAGCVCSLLSKALPPRGFLLRQDITWRRLFTDLACVSGEPCWGWEGIRHLQGDCTDAWGGSHGVTSSAVLCA